MFTQTEVLVIQGRENTRCSAKFKFKLMTRCIQYWKRRHVLDASWCWDTLTNIKLRVQVDSVNVQTAVRRWYGFDRHRALDQSLNSSLVLECVTWHPCSHESQCWGMWEKKKLPTGVSFFFFFRTWTSICLPGQYLGTVMEAGSALVLLQKRWTRNAWTHQLGTL